MDRWRWRAVAALGLLLLVLAGCGRGQAAPAAAGSPGVGTTAAGRPAPDFAFTTFDGERFGLADLKGKAVVLNFWASWCVPCRAEMPYFETTYRAYREKGVVFVGLAVQDDPESSVLFLEELGITYPTGPDEENAIAQRYTGVAFTRMLGVFGWVKRHYAAISAASGLLLVAVGVLFVTERFFWLSIAAQRLYYTLAY